MSATFVMVWTAFSKLIAGIGRFYPGGPILPLSTKISKGRLTYMSRLDLGLINMGLHPSEIVIGYEKGAKRTLKLLVVKNLNK